MLSSDEEGGGEPVRAEIPHADGVGSVVPPKSDQAMGPIPRSEEVGDMRATSSSTPFVSLSVNVQGSALDKSRPLVSSAGVSAQGTGPQPDILGSSSPPNAVDKGAAAQANILGPLSTPVAGMKDTREEPPVAPTNQGEGSGVVSLSDFSSIKLLNHFIHNDVYISKG